jgi:hypothetical protein
MVNRARSMSDGRQKHSRTVELQEYAKIAYVAVPSQLEMLNGGKPLPEFEPRQNGNTKATPEMDDALDEVLYEAAQHGNIGGG